MTEGRVLIDIDALCKLAHWELLPELPALLNVGWSSCSTLTSARFRALRSTEKPDGRTFKSTQAAIAVLDVIGQMSPLLDVSIEQTASFQGMAGIDPGEAVLLSVLTEAPQSRLLTGDKRALRALSGLSPGDRKPFEGRIIVVEQIIEVALDTHGLEWLRAKVCPWKQVDTAVSMIMGSRCDLAEVAVREGLASCINEIVRLCDPSLVSSF